MDEFDSLSPAEKEASIRREYASVQKKLNALVRQMTEEYDYFEFLRDQIAEIDIYGADDVFGSSKKRDTKASLARNGYDF